MIARNDGVPSPEESVELAPDPSDETALYTRCASYREAMDLAAYRRSTGKDGWAVFHVAMNSWCVR
jgi:hypothetical protein